MDNSEIPLISVPYPPELSVEEIISRRSDDRLRSRAPNKYFIYRMAYIKQLRKMIGDNISMIRISPYISSSWSKEPSEVKESYKRLSDLTEKRLKEIRMNNKLVIIHENHSSPPPPPPSPPINYNIIYEPMFFYPYFNYYYYDYYNNCYCFY